MLDRIPASHGETLDRAAYHRDFARHAEGLRGVIWKLERSQVFREPRDTSWQAFMAGDWHGALELLEKDREAVRTEARQNAAQGLEIRRVRVAELPIGPYLQWELHALKLLADEGFGLTVLTADQVAPLETSVQLPEVVVFESEVLYEVRYEPDWTPCGARRITDADVISAAAGEIKALYERGEPFLDFFRREVAPLRAPAV
ncbi:DUF6879 family protein [Actinomadura litoris]|uniref:DUF6879 domain-containing protein n=1 Tax=Actinomadura litoris TaxID=2678616 RepID=A0A7K1KVY4_9ACTN|nr:DUF6879 family protein [Actinomadura litoris]MUN36217.1 hypothetical protein [Actinomadura litoris]